jgi:hypothetical protein
MEKLIDVTVYSPIEDTKIKSNIDGSPMWKKAIHPDDLAAEQKVGEPLFKYKFKFDGLKPVQHKSTKKIIK